MVDFKELYFHLWRVGGCRGGNGGRKRGAGKRNADRRNAGDRGKVHRGRMNKAERVDLSALSLEKTGFSIRDAAKSG